METRDTEPDYPTDADLVARFESLGDPVDPTTVPALVRAGVEVWSYGYDSADPDLFTTLDETDLWAWADPAAADILASWAPFRVAVG